MLNKMFINEFHNTDLSLRLHFCFIDCQKNILKLERTSGREEANNILLDSLLKACDPTWYQQFTNALRNAGKSKIGRPLNKVLFTNRQPGAYCCLLLCSLVYANYHSCIHFIHILSKKLFAKFPT